MYNKLFTKILDSSIWLESITTRIVWLTMIAAMDEQGFVQFASIPNLALRARVPLSACEKAVACLEAPDDKSADPDHDGRRVERVPGGWMVLNAGKYRDLVTRAVVQAQTRERVARHRARRACNAPVTHEHVTRVRCNAPVTPSEAETETEIQAEVPDRATHAPVARASLQTSGVMGGSLPREHLKHAWCGDYRLCVPEFLHGEFVRRIGGDVADRAERCCVFYARTMAAIPPEQAIGDEPLTFWRKSFAAAFPSLAPAPIDAYRERDKAALAAKVAQGPPPKRSATW